MSEKKEVIAKWANLIVEELVQQGARYFCYAPGSRSTPLACAIAKNPKAECLVHFDERGIAFHGLGYAKATGKPAVIVTTSGTAVANLLPAIIEASTSKVPLIVLTADRPPELLDTGANQAIDQVKIFGDHIRHFSNLPCPDERVPEEFILTTVAQSCQQAIGSPSGPVHINCMYREPFFSSQEATLPSFSKHPRHETGSFTKYINPELSLSRESLDELLKKFQDVEKGAIVLGALPPGFDYLALQELAERLQWPIFPDVLSGARMGFDSKEGVNIPHFDLIFKLGFAEELDPPEVVLHLGDHVLSKFLMQYFEKNRPRSYVFVSKHGHRHDPSHMVSEHVICDPSLFCQQLARKLCPSGPNSWIYPWKALSENIEEQLEVFFEKDERFSEVTALRTLMNVLPEKAVMFIGNSMPIREISFFASSKRPSIEVFGSRGASGIDGNIATAFGISQGKQAPIYAILGDQTTLYDLNSLAMASRASHPMILFVVNNDGGGVFSFLPIAERGEVFEKYFGNPLGSTACSFEHAAKMFHWDYVKVNSQEDIKSVLAEATPRSMLVELPSCRHENLTLFKEAFKHLKENVGITTYA